MTVLCIVIAVFSAINIYQGAITLKLNKAAVNERRELIERYEKTISGLLDRIQAPSFAEYTNKVVREKKAEQPEEKVDPVEFVS